MGGPEGKRPLGRPSRRLTNNIKMHLQQINGVMNGIDLAKNRHRWQLLVNAVRNLRFS